MPIFNLTKLSPLVGYIIPTIIGLFTVYSLVYAYIQKDSLNKKYLVHLLKFT